MTTFKNKGISLVAVGLFAGVTSTAVQGCDEGGICGPCGVIAEGSVGISGSARLDGFFGAVGDINAVFVSVNADFEANIRGLAEVWGFEIAADAAIDASIVDDLMAHIQGEISASVDGGISINYAPPRCSASLDVAVEAQADCEVQAGCDIEAMPPEVSVACEGECSGSCDAECTGSVACDASAMGGISCEGSCEGSCALEVAASCEGTCSGTCTVNGEVQGSEGSFEGECAGECEGTCEMAAGAECSGTCQGTCVADASVMLDCGGEPPECRGSCSGSCSGSCEGTATPPSVAADCDASADCQASASASASANLECSPPSLEIAFEFNAALAADVNAQAAFRARIGELQVRGAAILQGFAQFRALFEGNAELGVESPIANLTAQIQGFASGDAGAEIIAEVPAGRINCVIPAFIEAGEILADLGGTASGTISAQASFAAGLGVG